MPSKQIRHTCCICGAKRVHSRMVVAREPHFGIVKYRCNIDNLPVGVKVSVYCSKRTP